MFGYIKKLLSKEKKSDIKSSINSITFILDENDQISIKLHISKISYKDIEQFADLLQNIQKDTFQPTILELLIDLSKQSPQLNYFSKTTIERWSKKIYDDIIHKPLISPSEFYNPNN